MNKQIAVYDNTISARTYISYIAEQAGGFACIGRDGKLYIKAIGEDIEELSIDNFGDYKWGEEFQFTRVRYEDGVQLFEKGDTTGNTIYINQDNMYIVDQEQIDNIYNLYEGLEVYSFEGSSIIDPALDIGDILIIDDKKVIYQGSSEYSGKFKANIQSKIQIKAKEETMAKIPSQKTIMKRVQSEINQIDGRITQMVVETEELEQMMSEQKAEQTIVNNQITSAVSSNTTRIEQLNTDKVDSTDYETTIQNIQSMITQTNNQVEIRFQNMTTTTDNISNIITTNQELLEEYIRFQGALIELGRVGNDFTAQLSNTELAFLQNGVKIAYISNNKLYITDAEVQNKLTIGNFAFVPRENGNLSFTWIGG